MSVLDPNNNEQAAAAKVAQIAQQSLSVDEDIVQQQVSTGFVHGTAYFSKTIKPSRGVLLIGGFSGNRYGMEYLAKKLVKLQCFCLSIDLPQHYENTNNFSMGLLSETILQATSLIRKTYGFSSVHLIGHSMGALGSLFAAGGYNRAIESSLYQKWQEMLHWVAILNDSSHDSHMMQTAGKRVEEKYNEIKEVVLAGINSAIQAQGLPTTISLLAPPQNAKKAMPGLSLLVKCPFRVQKFLVELVLHKPAVAQGMKEGNLIKYKDMSSPDKIHWQCFSADETYDFLQYFLQMKEPLDYLTFLEQVSALRHKENKATFFEYYLKKMRAVPKLFIYGKRDLYLMPFWPGNTARIENFYKKTCENAIIKRGDMTHVMMKNKTQQMAGMAVDSDEVFFWIVQFLATGRA